MNSYNCEPLTVGRLRQSVSVSRENANRGVCCAAWQIGIQQWAADEIERLQKLVKAAYVEGWSDGLGEPDTYKQPEEGWWEDSVVYKHLANHEQQGKGNE